uniref:Uncharacterized protein n=1 Tax=Amphimedon queenslandica TaxID=400682 RepID=A0A1X7UEP0_AMPQE
MDGSPQVTIFHFHSDSTPEAMQRSRRMTERMGTRVEAYCIMHDAGDEHIVYPPPPPAGDGRPPPPPPPSPPLPPPPPALRSQSQ